MSVAKVVAALHVAQQNVLDVLIPRPVVAFDLKQVADIIRDMSGSWAPDEMLHDCDMEVEVGADGRLWFRFYRKADRRDYCDPPYAKAR